MKPPFLFPLGVALFVPLFAVSAYEVATTPLGVVRVTVSPGTGTGRAQTGLSVPLEEPLEGAGKMSGRITSLTSNTLSNSSAEWTPGGLSVAASPTLIRITSGAAKGRTFLVSVSSANTATTLTVDANDLGTTNLAALGIATGAEGDTYQLLQAHTLATLFGTEAENGILSGTNPANCDQVHLMAGGTPQKYYLNDPIVSEKKWKRAGPDTVSNNVVVKPGTGVVFDRLANTPLEFVFLGTVPTLQRIVDVPNAGSTTLSTGWAVKTTLAALNLPSLPGWNSNDRLKILSGGTYNHYKHDGTNWRRIGPETLSNQIPIPAGTVYVIERAGSTPGSSSLLQSPPYSL